jgi:hypothetical protein
MNENYTPLKKFDKLGKVHFNIPQLYKLVKALIEDSVKLIPKDLQHKLLANMSQLQG